MPAVWAGTTSRRLPVHASGFHHDQPDLEPRQPLSQTSDTCGRGRELRLGDLDINPVEDLDTTSDRVPMHIQATNTGSVSVSPLRTSSYSTVGGVTSRGRPGSKIRVWGSCSNGDTPRSLGFRTTLCTGSKHQVDSTTTPHQPPPHHFLPPTAATRPSALCGHHGPGLRLAALRSSLDRSERHVRRLLSTARRFPVQPSLYVRQAAPQDLDRYR